MPEERHAVLISVGLGYWGLLGSGGGALLGTAVGSRAAGRSALGDSAVVHDQLVDDFLCSRLVRGQVGQGEHAHRDRVGEHQPGVRAAVCERLAWLGVELDDHANAISSSVISTARSRVTVLVLTTDEEQIIANETMSVLHSEGVTV